MSEEKKEFKYKEREREGNIAEPNTKNLKANFS